MKYSGRLGRLKQEYVIRVNFLLTIVGYDEVVVGLIISTGSYLDATV
jgi:hypothetical protein